MATPIPVTEKCNTAAIVAVVLLMRLSESYGRVEAKASHVSAKQLFLFETISNEFYSRNSKINNELDLEKINENMLSVNRLVGMNGMASYSVINDLRKTKSQLFQSPQSIFQTYWRKQRKTINNCKLTRIQKKAKDLKKSGLINRVKRGRYGEKISGKPFGSISNTLSKARRKSIKNTRDNIHEVKATRLAFDKIYPEIFSLKLISTKHSKTNFYGKNIMSDKSTALKLTVQNVTMKSNSLHKKTSIKSTHNLKTGTAKHRLKSKATNKQKSKPKSLINSTEKGHTSRNRLKLNKSMTANPTGFSTDSLPKTSVTTRLFDIIPGGYFKSDEKGDSNVSRNSKIMRGVTPYFDKTMRNNTNIFKDMYMYIPPVKVNESDITDMGEGYYDQGHVPKYNVYNDYNNGKGYYDTRTNYSYGTKNELYNILVFNFFTSTENIPLFCPTAPKTTTLCPEAEVLPDLIRETLLFDYNVVVAAAVTGFIVLMLSLCCCMSCGVNM